MLDFEKLITHALSHCITKYALYRQNIRRTTRRQSTCENKSRRENKFFFVEGLVFAKIEFQKFVKY